MVSPYHYEFYLFEYGLYDKHVICEFIKEIASSKNIITDSHKLIVLHSIHKCTTLAHLALRRLMELLDSTARFILSTNQLNKVDDALISRCLNIRVPFPHNITEYLDNIELK